MIHDKYFENFEKFGFSSDTILCIGISICNKIENTNSAHSDFFNSIKVLQLELCPDICR